VSFLDRINEAARSIAPAGYSDFKSSKMLEFGWID